MARCPRSHDRPFALRGLAFGPLSCVMRTIFRLGRSPCFSSWPLAWWRAANRWCRPRRACAKRARGCVRASRQGPSGRAPWRGRTNFGACFVSPRCDSCTSAAAPRLAQGAARGRRGSCAASPPPPPPPDRLCQRRRRAKFPPSRARLSNASCKLTGRWRRAEFARTGSHICAQGHCAQYQLRALLLPGDAPKLPAVASEPPILELRCVRLAPFAAVACFVAHCNASGRGDVGPRPCVAPNAALCAHDVA